MDASKSTHLKTVRKCAQYCAVNASVCVVPLMQLVTVVSVLVEIVHEDIHNVP